MPRRPTTKRRPARTALTPRHQAPPHPRNPRRPATRNAGRLDGPAASADFGPIAPGASGLRGGAQTLYVRIGDSQPDNGWGGWLGRVKLVMQRG